MRSSWTPISAISLALLAGCGAEAAPRVQIDYEQRLALVTDHPYEFTCGDERHVNRFGKRAYFALADIERFAHMSRLRAATSIFYGVQEVCKGRPDTYKPMREAVAGVRSGRYVST
ncbi:hypothetical protein OJ997_34365 [Solirubrobacter phytolaccae]|uniref:Uncharacterized protein n=1 Tax=Solirubrobacter phytolaccae TaxID=1404360 RepID=A0A9X3NQ25_9ACTN|nr:hypothetical protein [Solirubrobacter phytolaccae]MDA0185442.1 hypothetical protein [Solirubrobacter phytolaccae]